MNRSQLKMFIVQSNLIEGIEDKKEIGNTIDAWDVIKDKTEITVEDILKVHLCIMKNLYPEIGGKFRNCMVSVGGRMGEITSEVPKVMDKWVSKYGHGVKHEEEAKQAHIEFEYIHPFKDGNGRVGRLLWLWHRDKADFPFAYIHIHDRDEYYKWFKEVK